MMAKKKKRDAHTSVETLETPIAERKRMPSNTAKWAAEKIETKDVNGGKYTHFKEMDSNHLTHIRAITGLWEACGVPSGLVGSDWKEYTKNVLRETGGTVRRSALRAVLQGDIPGVPAPAHTLRQQKKIEQVLALADMAETIAYNYVQAALERERELLKKSGRRPVED